ncbi:serine/threonine-protein kinase [Marichromatium gracile]|uniref:Serine/threonine protein kinase n=1 Tax=Marichromatium gracile TaxID=1048 RepID=A0ABR5VPV8_MARGR|nr:serine/threonine-protein kinase [Marichromatium gracile]KXX66288.1 serine/threonine protein kinase [Marichromatium gracile]
MALARQCLSPGTLVGAYQLAEVIGKGGFSLIYLAHDLDTGAEVVIKEYMPKKLARRRDGGRVVPMDAEQALALHHGRRLFFQEVQALASLSHPSIVRVLDFFLANDTGYLVMPNERGRNLSAYLQQRRGGVSTTFLLDVFVPVLDALALMHRHAMVHLDVKPGNIHLRHGNQPLLLDLGAVHPLNRERARGSQVVTAGYSPVEQYFSAAELGPWTDVYAVGASIRTCMERKTPPPALERKKEDTLVSAREALAGRYPGFLLEAVDWAMQMEAARRPRDASALLDWLRPHLERYRTGALTSAADSRPSGVEAH